MQVGRWEASDTPDNFLVTSADSSIKDVHDRIAAELEVEDDAVPAHPCTQAEIGSEYSWPAKYAERADRQRCRWETLSRKKPAVLTPVLPALDLVSIQDEPVRQLAPQS